MNWSAKQINILEQPADLLICVLKGYEEDQIDAVLRKEGPR